MKKTVRKISDTKGKKKTVWLHERKGSIMKVVQFRHKMLLRVKEKAGFVR